MRQHPIPQNILDVEFKLFTKFTLKEFAYLAIGIGLGGVLIYLTVGHTIPAIVGIPGCILSSGAGIFLGLVPINDQDADVFIKNYVNAITTPTQRVWLNQEMKEKRNKPELKPTADGKLVQKSFKDKVVSIIGGNVTNPQPEEAITEEPTEPQEPVASPSELTISDSNRSKYEFSIQNLEKLPGNINVWLYTQDMVSTPNVITYMKDENDKVVYANRTGPSGYFLTNKIWPKGIYHLEFVHPQYRFPKVKIIVEQEGHKLPIKIKNI